ncbi:MAG TPA: efflux RND transporter periplasmic adaptor subunit [Puia sp.]|jgi:membrane fusion protein (multidrug efflux system)|nr:efflux RND transporter periplasmic adaptor subunit [Puia sp.]
MNYRFVDFSFISLKSIKSFQILVLIIIFFYSCSNNKEPEKKPASSNTPKYILAKIEKAKVSEQLKLPAQLAAYQEVDIFPKENGYVKTVSVDIGSHVKKGKILMTLEAPELDQAVVQAKEKYARAKSDYTIDKENYERLKEASQTAGAISPLDLATAKAKADADSSLSNAEKANWQMQQTMMGYLIVTAPFNGVITQRNVHPGALVSAEAKDGKPMLELKQVDHLRLEVDIPESAVSSLNKKNDSVSFSLSAFPGVIRKGHISRISMNINAQYRSERIELDVYNADGSLAPGMYADVIFNSEGNQNALSVPKSAVIISTERKYVLVVRNNKAVKVDVITGNESNGKTEIVGALQPGEEVISDADDEIKEGTVVIEK